MVNLTEALADGGTNIVIIYGRKLAAMVWRIRKYYVLLFIIKFLAVLLFMQGCKGSSMLSKAKNVFNSSCNVLARAKNTFEP